MRFYKSDIFSKFRLSSDDFTEQEVRETEGKYTETLFTSQCCKVSWEIQGE
jgi:hypothetical protein